jgi:type II secretory pathway predicted ATPase ExeA
MYRKHFAFTHLPFRRDVAPEDLFASTGHQELRTRIHYLVEMCGIGLATGESGSGKTTVCRSVIASLNPGLYRSIYVPLSTGNVMDVYKTIAWELGLPTERNRASLYKQIRSEVSRLVLEARCRPILIIDEAHHLRSEVLEDLRLLTNFAMDSDSRLILLLVGHPELRRRLHLAAHEALSQRIIVRGHLCGLTRDELPAYLAHLLRLAGCEVPLFEPAAQEALYQATNGLPRKVNSLAHHALLAAALGKAKTVSAEHVQAALPEVS